MQKTKKLIKISYIINMIMFAVIALMLIPLTENGGNGPICLPNYEKALFVLLVLAFVAGVLSATVADHIRNNEKKSDTAA